MLNESVLYAGNVAIVQSKELVLEQTTMSAQEFSTYSAELQETVNLAVAQSKPIVLGEYADIMLLFGSWVESGGEDNQLKELYNSRLIPSASSDDEIPA